MPLDQQAAIQAAWAGLQDEGLLSLPKWQAGLGQMPHAGTYRTREIVRLDVGGAYILVALMDSGGGALVGVDASDGRFLWARLHPSARIADSIYKPVTPLRPPEIPGDVPVTSRVVWTPSKESFFSPYFPFVEFKRDDGPPLYVRMFDEKVFPTLTITTPPPPPA